jgi:RalA-binding protein 1
VLGKYLQDLLRLDLRDATDICAFFLSNVAVQAQSPVASPGHKDGYLTKKGRNFGKWQTRFYAISPAPESANKDPEQGPVAALHYYDTVR